MVSVPQAEKKTLPGVLGSFFGLCLVTKTIDFTRVVLFQQTWPQTRFRNQDRTPFRLYDRSLLYLSHLNSLEST